MSFRLVSRVRGGLRLQVTAGLTLTLAVLLAAAAASTLGATSLGANHAAAQRDAAGLLARVILPAGAMPASKEPAGDDRALGGPPVKQAGVKVVDRHRWWTIPEPVSTVYGFVRSHVPPSAKLSTWSGPPGSIGAPAASFAAYAFPPGIGYLPMRELAIAVVGLPGGSTGVRADAQVQWIIPRPRGERIPSRARLLDVTVGRPGAAPLAMRTVTDPHRVRRIAAMIDSLQTVQPEAINCPSYPTNAPEVTFTFRAAPNGAVLARASEPAYATEPTTPCAPMTITIDGRRWKPLLGGASVVHVAQQMLHIKLQRSG
ncbi:MAG: hypothetical protein ACR2NR_05560 [Solirubrobacteraceae bacterium]